MHQKIALCVLLVQLTCLVLAECKSHHVNHPTTFHPCESPVKEVCVRKYLSKKSNCKPIANGKNLDPSYLEGFYLEAPTFNISEYKPESKFIGLANSYPLLLKVDESATYTILTVFHPKLIFEGLIDVFFYSEGNAPEVVYNTTFHVTYQNFTTTTMIPGTKSLDMDSGRTFAALSSAPDISLSVNMQDAMSKSDLVNRTMTALLNDIPTLVAEEGLTIYPRLARSYIGQNLCTYRGN